MNHQEYLRQTKQRNKEIVKKREDGKTLKEIADEYGISPQRIDQIYKRAKQL